MSIKFPDETRYLDMITGKLKYALKKLNTVITNYSDEFKESMKYLWENRSGMDPMEVFSNERSVSQIVNSGAFTVRRREIIEKLIDSPYFARIDFRLGGEEEAEAFYIGRFTFVDADGDMLIYDWRAPISGMFYDYEQGPASYEAPAGLVEGDLTLKRQFKIRNGVMEYALESSISINDEILQKELSNTSDQRMKNIVATIQKEQNRIIRNEEAEVLVIQGVAGSGKTSIALHRVAFLLYKYKNSLSASDVIIISPNKVFADYISNVLPELGEEPITEIGFEDIASELLDGSLEHESNYEQIEKLLEGKDQQLADRVSFKSSPELLLLLDNYLKHAVASNFNYGSTLMLYAGFYDYINRPDMLVLKDNKLEASDVFPYLYCKISCEGTGGYSDIRHLVIDEMQDYTPVQYAVIKKLFKCDKTILGDFGQSIDPCNSLSREALMELYGNAGYVELKKSYRSTFEILKFAQGILDHGIEPVERHGTEPQIIRCGDRPSEISKLHSILEGFKKSGYRTLGIICRSDSNAKELHRELKKKHEINRLDLNSSKFAEGITITSIHMAKGLEFDEAVIPSADSVTYSSEHDRSLLYIACTRAMHKLTLTYHGEISGLLSGCL